MIMNMYMAYINKICIKDTSEGVYKSYINAI
jgi:hypothetical protein